MVAGGQLGYEPTQGGMGRAAKLALRFNFGE
jgi:hypothetical protein